MFFDGLNSVVRVVLIGTLAYAALVILLPASGNCTLSKMNSFEFVITAALGSALSALLTDSSLALVTGLTAIALLILLQFGMTWLSVRSRSLNLSPSRGTDPASTGRFEGAPASSRCVHYSEVRS